MTMLRRSRLLLCMLGFNVCTSRTSASHFLFRINDGALRDRCAGDSSKCRPFDGPQQNPTEITHNDQPQCTPPANYNTRNKYACIACNIVCGDIMSCAREKYFARRAVHSSAPFRDVSGRRQSRSTRTRHVRRRASATESVRVITNEQTAVSHAQCFFCVCITCTIPTGDGIPSVFFASADKTT